MEAHIPANKGVAKVKARVMQQNPIETPLRVVAPTLRKLPPMETFDEAQAPDRAEHTPFYTAAFLLQAGITEQFAEVPQPELRLFQQGHALAAPPANAPSRGYPPASRTPCPKYRSPTLPFLTAF